jgi:hypothetical protein
MMNILTTFDGFFGGNLVDISYQIIRRFLPVISKKFLWYSGADEKTRGFD